MAPVFSSNPPKRKVTVAITSKGLTLVGVLANNEEITLHKSDDTFTGERDVTIKTRLFNLVVKARSAASTKYKVEVTVGDESFPARYRELNIKDTHLFTYTLEENEA